MNYPDPKVALAAVAAALNDESRSEISDPRQGVYRVSLQTADMKEAMQLARHLATLGIIPKTVIEHDQFGNPHIARVTIWPREDRKHLFNRTHTHLKPERRTRFEDLIRVFEPIPAEVLERMRNAHQRGMSHAKIAEHLNQLDLITGMGGKSWTARKVRAALAEPEQPTADQREAA